MDEAFAFGDFSQDEVQKLYDADSRPVEFTKKERVDAGVVRERSTNCNSVDGNHRRNSVRASSPEFPFLAASELCNSSSEFGKQIQFLSSSVMMGSFAAAAAGSSVATTSPSSLSTGASLSSVDSPPRCASSSQNSSGPSQPRTPSKLNVHAKEFVPSNLSIISSSSVETKNNVISRLTPPTSVPTSPPSSTKQHPAVPVTKPSGEAESTCEWPTVEELHNPSVQEPPASCPGHTDTDNPRTASNLPLSPSSVEPIQPLATVCEVTESNGVMGNSEDSRGIEYCSLGSKETKEESSTGESSSQQEEQQICSSRKPDAQGEGGNGFTSGSDGGTAEAHALSPKSLSPGHVNSDPSYPTPLGDTDPARTSADDDSGIDARTHPPSLSPVTSSSTTPSQSQPLALSQSSSASSSSSIPLSSPCPQAPKLKKSSRSWASVVGTSKAGSSASSTSHTVSVNEPRRTSLPASAPDAGRRNDKDKRSSLGIAGREISVPDECALSRLKALGDQLRFIPLCHEPVSVIPRGLHNSGNLCYIHAPLQALLSCPEFFNTLNSLSLPKQSELTSATAATDSMIQLVKKYEPYPVETTAPFSRLASPHAEETHLNGSRKRMGTSLVSGPPFKPEFVYEMLSRIESSLSTQGRQEDAEEFLGCVLDRLHEEMVSARSAASASATSSPERGESEGVAEAGDEEEWEEVGPRNKSTITRRTAYSESPVSAIFGGKLQSSVHRLGKKESATVQPFFSLQLDIQNEEVWSVKDAMEALASKEPINLPGMEEIRAFRRVTLAHLPPMLILHIKRFLYLGGSSGSQKLTKHISYTTEMEIPKDILAPAIKGKLSPQQRTYQLWAVVYHHGRTPNGGHYTCEVYHPPTESWLRTDDSLIKQIPEEWVYKPSVQRPDKVAYLLFYRRHDTINHRRDQH